MIRSMTGFASVSREAAGDRVHITMKSVNHRFLDVAVKLPQALAPLDQRVRAIVQQRLSRGRVELQVAAEVTTPPEREVVLDEALLDQIVAVIERAREKGVVAGPLTPSDLVRLPQVLEIRTRPAETGGDVPASLAALVDLAVTEALDALIVMRETEGRFLAADLDGRLQTMAGYVETLARESGDGQRQLEARLRERVAQLPPDLQGDPAALAQEIVRVVARSDVDEEIVRLRGHLEHWHGLAGGAEPCGRKLDFLVQEMNREINTIGSKVEGSRGTEIVIEAKAELERIKEQVQNVE
ncbi:MAG: YicC family protein [Acidobacteria bacterium SCN 69-37]|nr:MAG: YicC family protein [Acidobacteria bacterium SCN 69-37]